jgi:two-component system chemotaxis response regulator CheY
MNCNVLIVDDSPILRAAVKKVVSLTGVPDDHIFQAGNGVEALEALNQRWIDLVLLDLNMPVMSGEEFVQEVRQRPELDGLAIVIVSTEANQQRLARLAELGVTESLHKPFEPEDLCQLIHRALGVRP